VYNAIQRQAEKASQQNQGLSSEAPAQKLPRASHPIGSTIPQNSYSSTQESEEPAHPQAPVARGRNRRLSYSDAQGNFLHPASIRPDPDPHRAQSDPTEPGGKMWALPGQDLSRDVTNPMGDHRDNRHAPTTTESFPRPTVSSPLRPLPTLHEHRQLAATSFTGDSELVDKLDHREYFPNVMLNTAQKSDRLSCTTRRQEILRMRQGMWKIAPGLTCSLANSLANKGIRDAVA
jgi:hypothetical protein